MLGNLVTVLLISMMVVAFLLVWPMASAATARSSILARLRPVGWGLDESHGGSRRLLLAAGTVFLLVVGIGSAASYLGPSRKTAGPSHAAPQSEALTRLENYTRTSGGADHAQATQDGKPLGDVNTMIDRLAARLANQPDDLKGWRMLGWSYFHTGRFKEAEGALARAVALDPTSDELKDAYEKAKASGSSEVAAQPSTPADHAAKEGPNPSAEQVAAMQAMPPQHREAAIRGMVDGLAARLEADPRDIEGWMRLMRSRMVLGEKDGAATAYKRALDIFKDDAAAVGKIAAAASGLGLSSP